MFSVVRPVSDSSSSSWVEQSVECERQILVQVALHNLEAISQFQSGDRALTIDGLHVITKDRAPLSTASRCNPDAFAATLWRGIFLLDDDGYESLEIRDFIRTHHQRITQGLAHIAASLENSETTRKITDLRRLWIAACERRIGNQTERRPFQPILVEAKT